MTQNTPSSIVTASFRRVPAGAVVERFYAVLFERNPGVRAMFPNDLSAQRGKLGSMLVAMIRGLGDLEALTVTLEDLGYRHAAYGTQAAHFPAVGDALVTALSEADPEWSDEVAGAWVAIYGVVTDAMVRGLERGLAERAA